MAAKSLLLPKPRGKKKHSKTSWSSSFPSEPHGPLFTSPKLPDPGPLPFPSELHGPLFTSEPHGPLSIHLLQNLMVLPFTSEPRGLLLSMAAGPRFKSQRPSSSAAPFPTPPTISYTCQHSCILPTSRGCHSKSRQAWAHGMEPIISKLSRRH